MSYTITEDNNLKVSNELYNKDGSVYIEERTYSLKFLNEQRVAINTQRDEMIKLKEAELNEVDKLISACKEVGITE